MSKEERAGNLLVGYFRTIAERAGIRWDFEMDGEIRDAVRCIIDAAVSEAAEQNPAKTIVVCPECNSEGLRFFADGDADKCTRCNGMGKLN